MSPKLYSIIDEYLFLKEKITRIFMDLPENKPIVKARMTKKAKKYVCRMIEIEDICKQMGYPHPDAAPQPKHEPEGKSGYFDLNVLNQMRNSPKSLYSKPDGTLFETPKMEGSILPRKTDEPE